MSEGGDEGREESRTAGGRATVKAKIPHSDAGNNNTEQLRLFRLWCHLVKDGM